MFEASTGGELVGIHIGLVAQVAQVAPFRAVSHRDHAKTEKKQELLV